VSRRLVSTNGVGEGCFALGVMNLIWIAALAILVLLEKVMPSGRAIARIVGIASFAEGVWMLFQRS
jgi:predicted metal-binding membrane protein